MARHSPIAALLLVGLLGCGKEAGASDGSQAEGAKLFASTCARCHGAKGLGGIPQPGGKVSRNLADPAFQNTVADGDLEKIIREGKPPAMPAFAQVLDDQQIKALIQHVRSLPN